MFILHKEIMT